MLDLTHKEVEELFGNGLPCEKEEHVRPWRQLPKPRQEIADKPLLRLWDINSRSRPDGPGGNILADHYRCPIRDIQTRRRMLASHIDNKNRTQRTPFISFTVSPQDIERIARQRQHRPRQRLTVVDPRSRLMTGLGVVSCYDELKYYGVQDPYGNNDEYYKDEYLCLWQVNVNEIVDTWWWDELAQNPKWFEEIVFPKWQRLRKEWEETCSMRWA